MTINETDELIVRVARSKDAPYIQALYADGRVMQHLGGPKNHPLSVYETEIAKERNSLEYLTIENKAERDFMGRGSLRLFRDYKDGYENIIVLTWKYCSPPHRKGYGTKVFNVLASHAKDTLHGAAVYGEVHKTNEVCIRMLNKLGMKRPGEVKLATKSGERIPAIQDLYGLDLKSWRPSCS